MKRKERKRLFEQLEPDLAILMLQSVVPMAIFVGFQSGSYELSKQALIST